MKYAFRKFCVELQVRLVVTLYLAFMLVSASYPCTTYAWFFKQIFGIKYATVSSYSTDAKLFSTWDAALNRVISLAASSPVLTDWRADLWRQRNHSVIYIWLWRYNYISPNSSVVKEGTADSILFVYNHFCRLRPIANLNSFLRHISVI